MERTASSCRFQALPSGPPPLTSLLGNTMKRYSVKLLFQFRAYLGEGRSDTMRRCEERIIVLSARGAESALRKAKRYGKSEEFDAKAEAGNPIYFEFIGVADLLELGAESEPNEVWYDIVTLKLPSERRDRLIPKESDLNAIGWERRRKNMPNTGCTERRDRVSVSNPTPLARRR